MEQWKMSIAELSVKLSDYLCKQVTKEGINVWIQSGIKRQDYLRWGLYVRSLIAPKGCLKVISSHILHREDSVCPFEFIFCTLNLKPIQSAPQSERLHIPSWLKALTEEQFWHSSQKLMKVKSRTLTCVPFLQKPISGQAKTNRNPTAPIF